MLIITTYAVYVNKPELTGFEIANSDFCDSEFASRLPLY